MSNPNKGEFWVGNPKPPAPNAPADSWWTRPQLQTDRSAFRKTLDAEVPRIASHPRFGGPNRSHDNGLSED